MKALKNYYNFFPPRIVTENLERDETKNVLIKKKNQIFFY